MVRRRAKSEPVQSLQASSLDPVLTYSVSRCQARPNTNPGESGSRVADPRLSTNTPPGALPVSLPSLPANTCPAPNANEVVTGGRPAATRDTGFPLVDFGTCRPAAGATDADAPETTDAASSTLTMRVPIEPLLE